MNPHRTYEDNMAVLNKVLTQRTRMALSRRNIEFVLKHQNASLQELAAYLQRQKAELRHIPGRTEVVAENLPQSAVRPRWKRRRCIKQSSTRSAK